MLVHIAIFLLVTAVAAFHLTRRLVAVTHALKLRLNGGNGSLPKSSFNDSCPEN